MVRRSAPYLAGTQQTKVQQKMIPKFYSIFGVLSGLRFTDFLTAR
jgi:hypothetical protein